MSCEMRTGRIIPTVEQFSTACSRTEAPGFSPGRAARAEARALLYRDLKRALVAVAVIVCGPTGRVAALVSQQTTTFRAGVDLIVVDAVVINKSGAPVTDLVAGDFSITAGGRPRRVVSSEFVFARRAGVATSPRTPADLSVPTNNRLAGPAGRSIVFAVDVDEIRAGEGRVAMRAIANYVARLDAADRVGLVSLPDGVPRLDLTTDRQRFADITGEIVGRSRRMNDADMSPGEAAAIASGDAAALEAWLKRKEGLPPGQIGAMAGRCFDGCRQMAERTLDIYRRHTRIILDSLRGLAEAMAPLDGQKALVLVSEGISTGSEVQGDLRSFAAVAERARVALYALHLDAPLMEAATRGGPTALTRILDDRAGFDGMADLAYAARGTAFRVIADAVNPLRKIDLELSGYYLVAFERTAEDVNGRHVRIDVRVNRPGLEVRARTEFVPVAPESSRAGKKATVPPKVAMGSLLRWPAPVGDVAIDVDTFIAPLNATAREARVMVAAEIATGGRTVDVGFEVADAAGKPIADGFEQKADVRPLRDGTGLYLVSVSAVPGKHTLTLGVIDSDGRRGSVMHAFDVPGFPSGSLRMSSVFLGEVSEGAFRPLVRIGPNRDTVAARIEVHATSTGTFGGDVLRFDLMRVGETASMLTLPGRLDGAAGSTRRAATIVFDIRALPPGDYVVRATLSTAAGQLLAQSSRLLRREE